jgi:hypothetical protein
MQIKIYRLIFIFSIFSFNPIINGQVPSAPPTEYSPYSRFGYGQSQLHGNVISQGLAGATTAFVNDSFPCIYINASNPATLSSIHSAALEFGAQSKSSTFYAPNSENKAAVTNFHYAALAVPLRKFGGLAFGVSPDFQTGYSLLGVDSINNERQEYSYTGDGGLYKVFMGTGVKPFYRSLAKYKTRYALSPLKNYKAHKRTIFLAGLLSQTSIGANVNYHFGNNSNVSRNLTRFSDGTVTRAGKNLTNNISGYSINYGLITGFTIDSIRIWNDSLSKRKKLKHTINITFGYNAYLQSQITAREDYLSYNEIVIGGNVFADTIVYNNGIVSKNKMPAFQKFGVNVKIGEKLNFSADYGIEVWKNQIFKFQSSVFKDQTSYAFGLQYTPGKRSIGKNTFAKRITYRIGYRKSDGYLRINNTNIGNQSFHAGISLPLGRAVDYSFIHLNGEYGTIGTKNNGLIQEKYFKLVVGFSFNDLWFIKQRID